MSFFKENYTNIVRMICGLERAFFSAEMVCDVSVTNKEHSVTIRWDGYSGHFQVFDEDDKRWTDWRNPREPQWVCAMAAEMENLYFKAHKESQKNIKALKDSSKTLTQFLSQKTGSKSNAQPVPRQQAQ